MGRERLKSECEAGIEPRNLEEMNFQHVVEKKVVRFFGVFVNEGKYFQPWKARRVFKAYIHDSIRSEF